MNTNPILATAICLCLCGCNAPQTVAPAPTEGPTPTAARDGKVTAEEYNKISLEMPYLDVYSAIGLGEETSASKIGGVITRTYVWKNADGSSMTATFTDGVLTEKSQSGIS